MIHGANNLKILNACLIHARARTHTCPRIVSWQTVDNSRIVDSEISGFERVWLLFEPRTSWLLGKDSAQSVTVIYREHWNTYINIFAETNDSIDLEIGNVFESWR